MTEYRYTLTRDLSDYFCGAGIDAQMCWVMLNPSTATETVDDQTIRQVKWFTQQARYRYLIVVNLFAARATQPDELLTMDDPIGPDNEAVVCEAINHSARVVFAWGAWLRSYNARPTTSLPRLNVEGIAARAGHTPLCLGRTKNGSPKHPCRLPRSTPFEVY